MADEPLRILQILRAPIGGLFRHVNDLTRELAARGHQIGIVADSLTSDSLTAERLKRGSPVLQAGDDVYTNHIHADDLARACVAALHRGAPQRVLHASDDTELRMGDYFDLAAELCGLPRPPRIPWQEARQQLSPLQLSFMGESRRLDNRRLKRELRLRLRYPTVREGLQQPLPPGT